MVPPDELAYTKYYLTFLLSPVPEARAKAAWLQVVHLQVRRAAGGGGVRV